MVELTWMCHVCQEVRPDRFISVSSKDIGPKFGLELGTMTQNVRYCNDRKYCTEQALSVRLIKIRKEELNYKHFK